MADLKPPRFAQGERETLLALLQYQRDSLVRKVSRLEPVNLRWVLAHLLQETPRPRATPTSCGS